MPSPTQCQQRTRLTVYILPTQPPSFLAVTLNVDSPAHADATQWTAWAGTSLITAAALDAFLDFATRIYSSEKDANFVAVLERKRREHPFVCDMTQWYLFAAAADPTFADRVGWAAQRLELPPVPGNRGNGNDATSAATPTGLGPEGTGAAPRKEAGIHVCDSQDPTTAHPLGFDMGYAMRQQGFHFDPTTRRAFGRGGCAWRTLHFQGNKKGNIPEVCSW